MKTETTETINWSATKTEMQIIERISARAVKLAKKAGVEIHKIDFLMDLEACHCNGCRLDLDKLEAFPDSDFGHDVFGIRKHIDRSNGKLRDCFIPRCVAH
jgi:hypothetical protein